MRSLNKVVSLIILNACPKKEKLYEKNNNSITGVDGKTKLVC